VEVKNVADVSVISNYGWDHGTDGYSTDTVTNYIDLSGSIDTTKKNTITLNYSAYINQSNGYSRSYEIYEEEKVEQGLDWKNVTIYRVIYKFKALVMTHKLEIPADEPVQKPTDQPTADKPVDEPKITWTDWGGDYCTGDDNGGANKWQIWQTRTSSDGKTEYRSTGGVCGAPVGHNDQASCTVVWGWACDPNDFSEELNVHIYEDKYEQIVVNDSYETKKTSTKVGEVKASNLAEGQDGVGVAAQCGGTAKNHRYFWTIPPEFKDKKEHLFTAYSINIGEGDQANTNLGTVTMAACGDVPVVDIGFTVKYSN
jgi:hypothetical protein